MPAKRKEMLWKKNGRRGLRWRGERRSARELRWVCLGAAAFASVPLISPAFQLATQSLPPGLSEFCNLTLYIYCAAPGFLSRRSHGIIAPTMPKVISYTPPWLSRPSPGASLFSSSAPKDPGSLRSPKGADYLGPSRTLARRGNEVFTVVDNQIRWSSLTRLKDEWQQRARSKNQQTDADDVPYRVSIRCDSYCGWNFY